MHRKAYKFRLYPTAAQETTLRQTLETCRGVYNSLLHQRKHAYKVCGTSPSYYEQKQALPVWKKVHPELRAVFSQVLQDVVKRVDLAFEAFFRRVKAGEAPGFPRFKGRGQYDSLTYPQHGFALGENRVTLSKIGTVRAVLHRPLEGTVKTCTVRRQAGKWYVFFSCEVETKPLPHSEEQVGVDVGLNHFATLSNGEFLANPRFFRKEEKALAKAQRTFEKVKNKPRSKARRKAKKVVSRVHERIRNRRHDFHHQTAHRLVHRYGVLAVENLNVLNMSKRPAPKQDQATGDYLPNGACRKAGLHKSILDAGWGRFRQILKSKAESADRRVIEVSPAYNSQDCSACGTRVKKTLSERVHVCPCCGLVLDRDVNAARNILKIAVGLHSVPA